MGKILISAIIIILISYHMYYVGGYGWNKKDYKVIPMPDTVVQVNWSKYEKYDHRVKDTTKYKGNYVDIN